MGGKSRGLIDGSPREIRKAPIGSPLERAHPGAVAIEVKRRVRLFVRRRFPVREDEERIYRKLLLECTEERVRQLKPGESIPATSQPFVRLYEEPSELMTKVLALGQNELENQLAIHHMWVGLRGLEALPGKSMEEWRRELRGTSQRFWKAFNKLSVVEKELTSICSDGSYGTDIRELRRLMGDVKADAESAEFAENALKGQTAYSVKMSRSDHLDNGRRFVSQLRKSEFGLLDIATVIAECSREFVEHPCPGFLVRYTENGSAMASVTKIEEYLRTNLMRGVPEV